MQDTETFQGSLGAPTPYPTAVSGPGGSGITVPYSPVAGRADRLSANIPGMVGAIGNIGDKITGGMGGSNQ